ncbi:LamG domain-containing protein [Streptomyces sp. NBC_01451]|uniref:LamG domain-containing protein n=1 Tax=Streptomyces sp. NBC_01451 TaxID=2903872 RepID=UPI002E350D0E|nr:LamG domain-containing protein [Streptomyces sp. NBC_01451]
MTALLSAALLAFGGAAPQVASADSGAPASAVAVSEEPVAIGKWHFDESGGVAMDSSTAVEADQDNATLSASGASRDDRGRRGLITRDGIGAELPNPVTDTALTLDGSAGYAETAGPVVDTQASYTVSAWARIAAAPTHDYAVVSQVGTDATASGFSLHYSAEYKGWVFDRHWRDAAGASHIVSSYAERTSIPFGVWTYVAGAYDADARTIQLYVNGLAQGEPVTLDTGLPTAADGPFMMGRTLYTPGDHTDYFGGQIDEVHAWTRRLDDDEVKLDARLLLDNGYEATELVAAWNAAGASGSSLADTASGYGRSLDLSGGASLDGDALVLDGVDGAATASGPLVDETGSFTVMTSVSLDSAALADKPIGHIAQVLGQSAPDGSAWGFWYQLSGTEYNPETDTETKVGIWKFGRINADGTFTGAKSDEVSVPDDNPVRMTGVYDAPSGAVIFYLGVNQQGTEYTYPAIVGTGDFAVGKGRVGSGWGHYLRGSVTDVRIWAGAMRNANQIADVGGS